MPIYSRKNLYLGVNAHLQSALLNEVAGWESFHHAQIFTLAATLGTLLPPNYVVNLETAFQIREMHPDTGEWIVSRRRYKKPDVSVLSSAGLPEDTSTTAVLATAPTVIRPAAEALELDVRSFLQAVTVYRIAPETSRGRLVTWFELLSPVNKPPSEGYLQYLAKRTAALESGIVLVEIDYLHEARSLLSWLASYPDGEAGAYPYTIIVTDPRPTLKSGQLKVYGIGIDEVLPLVHIPLEGDDFVVLDFGAAYNDAYESISGYGARVDYAELPVNFDRYTPADQERIKARMAAAQGA